jgi:hypothetical protein
VHTITAAKGTEHLTLQCGSLGDIASVLFEIFKSKLSNWKRAAHRLGWLVRIFAVSLTVVWETSEIWSRWSSVVDQPLAARRKARAHVSHSETQTPLLAIFRVFVSPAKCDAGDSGRC